MKSLDEELKELQIEFTKVKESRGWLYQELRWKVDKNENQSKSESA